jgi:hypothetical protein
MGRAVGGPWRARWSTRAGAVLAPTLTALVTVLVPAAAAGASGTKGGAHAAPKLAQLGHATFWECSSKTTQLLVAVNTLTLHPGATLTITFTVRNGAATACNYTAPYADAAPGPTATTLHAGPCGSVGFEIFGPRHSNVYPGVQVVNCPALGFAQLPADGTVSGSGTWNQTKPNGTVRVPAGSYTLVVENRHFTFPLRVLAH